MILFLQQPRARTHAQRSFLLITRTMVNWTRKALRRLVRSWRGANTSTASEIQLQAIAVA